MVLNSVRGRRKNLYSLLSNFLLQESDKLEFIDSKEYLQKTILVKEFEELSKLLKLFIHDLSSLDPKKDRIGKWFNETTRIG